MSVQHPVIDKTDSKAANMTTRLGDARSARFELATFVENFEVLAEAPGGVESLRRLIVDLAVRGILVNQRADEETGTQLIEWFRRRRQTADMQGRSPRQANGYADLDQEFDPFHVPSTWSWSTMGEIAVKLGAGSTPLGGKSVYTDAGVKFLRSQNVWNDGLRLSDVACIDRETHAKMSGTHIEPGDILLNITGASIGRTAVVPDTFDDGNVSQHVAIVRLVDKSIRRFVHLAMTATYFQDFIMSVQVGVSREGLSMKKLQHFPVPLPPIAEQKRIVAKVDELMRLIDDLEAKQAKKRETQVRLRTAALDALTSAEGPEEFDVAWKRVAENFGVLFEQAESIADLRATVLAAGLKGWLTRSSWKGETGLPRGWWRGALGELAGFVTSGSRNWKNYRAMTGAVFVRSQDIKTDALDLSSPAFVTVPADAEGTRTRIERNDILITITGANVGKVAHVDRDVPEAYVSQHVALVRLRDVAHARWVQRWLVSPSNGRRQLLGSSYGDKPGLNLNQVKAVVIDLPPLEERSTILEQIERKLKLCDELEGKLRKAEDAAAKLVDAVVSEMAA